MKDTAGTDEEVYCKKRLLKSALIIAVNTKNILYISKAIFKYWTRSKDTFFLTCATFAQNNYAENVSVQKTYHGNSSPRRCRMSKLFSVVIYYLNYHFQTRKPAEIWIESAKP